MGEDADGETVRTTLRDTTIDTSTITGTITGTNTGTITGTIARMITAGVAAGELLVRVTRQFPDLTWRELSQALQIAQAAAERWRCGRTDEGIMSRTRRTARCAYCPRAVGRFADRGVTR